MRPGRTLLLAIDGATGAELSPLLDVATPLELRPGGPSEPAPALTSLITGASVARTGIATEHPFRPDRPAERSTWYARSLTAPTLFDAVAAAGGSAAALQWPATAGAEIALCLPLVEDLRHFRNRWEMTERTSSERMVLEHLAPRRAAGVHLSQVPHDALVVEITEEACAREKVDLLAVRLTGLGTQRREDGPDSRAAVRALGDTLESAQRVLAAFAPAAEDRVLLLPGRPLVPPCLLVHPNAVLAAKGLVRTEGTHLESFRALVWPDGPRGVVHVPREEGSAVRIAALEELSGLVELAARDGRSRLTLRTVEDGVGATVRTDVIAVLEGSPGTVFGLSATHRPLVDGEDPYYAGPRAVSDPSAATTALAGGPGLADAPATGSWADLGVNLARAMGLVLDGASAAGMVAASSR
ncbi:alkaline phosphatase family protein [Brachybacterium sp. J153]|uniref:alkaline phosphatase family protein n=1 Tax=Brachybacterium sp. J153 TaxID=3116488 RepID=UPI002E76BA9F|nr:alkaline phosphatase family protein [Brachybacterium sp. J153]MEE1619526.1 alkaline phosphatase family protein [Brachybacterium sp. J153]